MSRLVALAAVLALTTPAAAEVFVGEVIATDAAWQGDDIITTAIVRTADGEVVVEQLGGHADGYTMVVQHGPPPLTVGMRVEITAHALTTGARGASAAPRWGVMDVIDRDHPGRGPYVRTVTNKSRTPLRWAKGCVEVAYASEGTSHIPGDGERAVIESVFAAWNTGIGGCAYLSLASRGAVDAEVTRGDFLSIVKFRDDRWCRPAVDGYPERCHSHTAAAVTTAVFVDDPDSERDGELVDADIEMNGVDYAIAVNGESLGTSSCQADLANTLTHEVGHLLGLEHTCRVAADPPRVDGTGAAVPLCTATSDPEILGATMYPYQECGETSKASLATDDTAAICAIYPIAAGPLACEPPDELAAGCCATGGDGRGSLALAALLAAVLRRRRGRPGR
jgi:MYXO-CTERM domain-containing protein